MYTFIIALFKLSYISILRFYAHQAMIVCKLSVK